MKVTFGPAALRDIAQIASYLSQQGTGLVDRFVGEVEVIRERLADFPESGREIDVRWRMVVLQRFPYKLVYRRLGEDELRILRIRHARRRTLTL